MSDLISRQALMKEFSDFVRASNSSDFAQTPTWNDAVSLVGSMPSAQKWIPCSERLPEGNTIVLATTADYMYIVEFEVYSNGHMYWNEVNEYRSVEGVIAWMPLPPSFKEE